MAYTHIWQITGFGDGTNFGGGDLYDRYGNFDYFADTTGLVDKTQTGIDKTSDVGGFTRSHFMNSAGQSSVRRFTRYFMTGVRRTKGAIPGKTITLVSGDERRQFQITCSISRLVEFLKENAKVEITMYGPKGTPYDPIPVPAGEQAVIAPAR
jgi:hypothetical protein